MIVDAEFCILAWKNEPIRRLLIRRSIANPRIAHWASTFPIGNQVRPSSGNAGEAKAMGPDFCLYNDSAQVGTLKFFSFARIDTEAQTVLIYYDRHFDCQLDHASSGNRDVKFERHERGPLLWTQTRGNTQTGGIAIR
jgi:hypothetical protein